MLFLSIERQPKWMVLMPGVAFLIIVLLQGCSLLPDAEFVEKVSIQTEQVDKAGFEIHAKGNIIDAGKGLDDHGFCFAMNSIPEYRDNTISLGSTSAYGPFETVIKNLVPGNYFFTAYAIENNQVYYGDLLQFEVDDLKIETESYHIINETSFAAAGSFPSYGNFEVLDHGFVWSNTNYYPEIGNDQQLSLGALTSPIDEFSEIWMIPDHTSDYFLRSYATTSTGVYYGEIKAILRPIKPYNSIPADNGVIPAGSFVLQWESQDPNGFEIEYDLYFGTSSDPGLYRSKLSNNSLAIANLLRGTTYYWKVVSRNEYDFEHESQEWRFTAD